MTRSDTVRKVNLISIGAFLGLSGKVLGKQTSSMVLSRDTRLWKTLNVLGTNIITLTFLRNIFLIYNVIF